MSPPVINGDRDGQTFDHDQDYNRLNKQSLDVWRVMADGKWHTLPELSTRTGWPEASISARIRDFRKPKFGAHTVDRRRHPFIQGLHEYLLTPTV